jgi:hypothetical protein
MTDQEELRAELDALRRLPPGSAYGSAEELWQALGL